MIDTPTGLLGLVAGALLLIAGRRLFWLFVGLVGFFAGLRFAPAFLSGEPGWKQWLVAVLCGLLGMFLAVVLQRFAVVLAGFLVGGYVAAQLFGIDFAHPELTEVLIFVAGGIVAAALALWLFEGALILLSSLAGAGLITDALGLGSGTRTLALIGLTVLGIAIQAGITARRSRRATRASALLVALLLLGSGPTLAWQEGQSSGEIRIAHLSTTRFVGTIRSVAPIDFPFEPAKGETVIPLDFVVRRIVRVHVDRWIDEPAPELEADTLALFIDNPRTYFVRRPFIGKTWLFTLTSTLGRGGSAYKLEVGPHP